MGDQEAIKHAIWHERCHECPCHDCGAETMPADYGQRGEWYVVTDNVWHAGGLGTLGGYLCIGCLEARIGRRLTPADFTDAPINNLAVYDLPRWAWSWRTARLIARMSGWSS
jgi:hypothetical protein